MLKLEEWRGLAQSKTDCAARLIEHGEWILAAETMGYALECALKAVACKTLNLTGYPPMKGGSELAYFKTHEFDTLLILSGTSDIFGPNSLTWSNFTFNYTGNWPEMRYDTSIEQKFTEDTVRYLYGLLYDNDDSLMKTLEGSNRW